MLNDPPVIRKPAVGIIHHPKPVTVAVRPSRTFGLQIGNNARPVIRMDMIHPEMLIVPEALRRIAGDLLDGVAHERNAEIPFGLPGVRNNRQRFQKQGEMIVGLFEGLLRPVTLHQFGQERLIGLRQFRRSFPDTLLQLLVRLQKRFLRFLTPGNILQRFNGAD